MSREDYLLSRELTARVDDDNYYALIMAAIRGADCENLRKLQQCWPEVCAEFRARYHAPAGLLPGEEDTNLGIRRQADGSLVPIE